MQKRILTFLLTSCLSFMSIKVMALTCGDNLTKNTVESNNYIFQILDYIDSPIKGIKQEVRNSTTKLGSDSDVNSTTAKHTLMYDSNGLITQSHYDLYSEKDIRIYSEHLQKNKSGWENIIEDAEDKTNSIIQFSTDEQGKIVLSQQTKKAADFVFVETDNYMYDTNNCLINKNVQWQLKEIDENGQYTGTEQKGASTYTFEYQNQQLAKVLYQFSNNMKNESDFSYQYDNEHHRLMSIDSSYLSAGKEAAHYVTKFLTFNEKNDWLTASKVKNNQGGKQTTVTRELTYY
ncbi:hypothetical protein GQ597_00075 [Gilliamella sp. Pra-s65]|uniref:hypothetical protein n=1 Tax=unclassified Gilliamella TaxID=2685620 RepID=UPI001327C956|nr:MULTISPECIES: hypothetical protein [unclassified Gilliamella]MWN31734.1 hypothetical protein [Gilliamella sp. Pra-s60]MWN89120.1 hypothetical protein [Gilliamella sp. Pra-s65]MWP28841.1 hypothetical protein [Gilliamella sp. Pra-s54]MWP47178.1 hypothetical protein [Gilliamella sp. Pas-s27]MWP72163.1 hypothetical protein [Gilliamella sp. Pra-s52]